MAKAGAKQKLGPAEPVTKAIVTAVQARKPKRHYTAGSGVAIFGISGHFPAGLRGAARQVRLSPPPRADLDLADRDAPSSSLGAAGLLVAPLQVSSPTTAAILIRPDRSGSKSLLR